MDKIADLELKISKFLRGGIFVAGFFIFLGWIARFQWSENPFVRFQKYQRTSFFDMAEVHFMSEDWAFFVSYAGLFILISLPIIRVTLTGILFFKQKEKILGIVAFIVLFFLLLSFGLGFEI
jgi:uncharacterized membrane protein